jgi:hypothetical protein
MIGFVSLCEAADAIGRTLFDQSWRPLKEVGTDRIPSDEELIEAGYRLLNADGEVDADSAKSARSRFVSTLRAEIVVGRTDPEIERVICLLAERCEVGEVGTWYRSITGADALDCSIWRASHWRLYFVDGEIELDLPLIDDKFRPVGDGRTARCRREIFVRKQELDRLIEALPPPPLAHTNLRYRSDVALIQEAVRALKTGKACNPNQAAKLVCQRAQGPSLSANLDRLRKSIASEWKERTAKSSPKIAKSSPDK